MYSNKRLLTEMASQKNEKKKNQAKKMKKMIKKKKMMKKNKFLIQIKDI